MKKLFYVLMTVVFSTQLAWADSHAVLTEKSLPPEFEANYDVYKGSMRVGKMEVSLKKSGDEVVYESITKPVGMAAFFLGDQVVTDRAVLKRMSDDYRVIEFRHVMKNSDKNRNEHYSFDWENKKASIQYKDRKNELDILEHTFDNYSAQLLLMRPAAQEDSERVYSVISKGRLKEYVYQLEASELIDSKLGKFNANKFVRRKDDDEKTTYIGWYAEKMNYIPVKLDKYKNGKLDISIQISDINWLKDTN